ncbi:MAG: hypothetical protein RBQ91_00645 [Acholeplasma sp.]|nr:hypothetical protein [Acholeplasma sp.]
MIKKVSFLVVSLLLMALVYMLTLASVISDRKNELLLDTIEKGNLTQDYTEYVKYATELYKIVDTSSAEADQAYFFQVFHTIESDKNGLFDGLIVFVSTYAEVEKASSSSDKDDQSKMIVTKSADLVYDSSLDDAYKGYPLSYGLSERGVYYYYLKIEVHGDQNLVLEDYSGNQIFKIDLRLQENLIDGELTKEENLTQLMGAGYQESFSFEEINSQINISKHLWKVYLFTGVFLLMDIMIGKFLIFRKK